MTITIDEISEFMSTELAIDMTEVDQTTPLFSTGMIDSFSLITLVVFLETRCNFRMPPLDVNLDNLDSIEKIISYLDRVTGQD